MIQTTLSFEPAREHRPTNHRTMYARCPCPACGHEWQQIVKHSGEGAKMRQKRRCEKCGAETEL